MQSAEARSGVQQKRCMVCCNNYAGCLHGIDVAGEGSVSMHVSPDAKASFGTHNNLAAAAHSGDGELGSGQQDWHKRHPEIIRYDAST